MKKNKILVVMFIIGSFIFETNAQNGGVDCENSVSIEPGSFTQSSFEGNSSIWYSFTPTEDGEIDLYSCLGGADTDLWFYNDCIGIPVITSDDECDDGVGDVYASAISNIGVAAGTTYYVEWKDTWSNTPFDWSLEYTANTGTPICEQVENINITNVTDTTVEVTWDETDYDLNGYLVEVYLAGDITSVIAGSDDYILEAPYLDILSGLDPETEYDLYVIAVCDLNEALISYSPPVSFTTGILGASSFETIIFSATPNPASELVFVETNVTIENVEIYNMLGQKVLQNSPLSNEFTLNVSNLEKGTYFIRATSNNLVTTKKLLKM